MKNIITIIVLTLYLMGCGAIENLGRECGGDMREGCRTLFGGNWNEEHDTKLDIISTKIKQIELLNNALMAIVFEHETDILTLNNDIVSINNTINTLADASLVSTLQSNLNLLTARVVVLENSIGTPVTGLQAIVTQNTITILQLQSNHNVTKIVDPCGDTPGKYDEVFLKTSTGKLIASFSDTASGLNTRFSELVPGTFTTTDGTSCTFTVTNVNNVLTITPSIEY